MCLFNIHNQQYEYLLAGMILAPEYNMPTRAVASNFKVELANFGVRFCNQKGLTGQLGNIHGKFSTEWRMAQSEFASLPLEKRGMVVHTAMPFAFHLIRQVERTVSHEQDVYLVKTFRAALPLSS